MTQTLMPKLRRSVWRPRCTPASSRAPTLRFCSERCRSPTPVFRKSILAKKSCSYHGLDLDLFIQLTNIPLRDCSAVRWTIQKIVNAGCGIVYFGQSPGIFIVPVFAEGQDETMFVCDDSTWCHMWVFLKDKAAKQFFLTALQVYASLDHFVELKNITAVERNLSNDANMAQGLAMAFVGSTIPGRRDNTTAAFVA